MVVDRVVMSTEDTAALQSAFTKYEGIKAFSVDALNNNPNDAMKDVVVELIGRTHNTYRNTWSTMLAKYFPDKQYGVGDYSWSCQFATGELVITEGGGTDANSD